MGKNSRQRHASKRRRAANRTKPSHGARSGAADRQSAACEQLERALGVVLRDRLWQLGWQPAELMRQVRRSSPSTPASLELVATAIVADAMHHERVGNDMHPAWRLQIERLRADGASHDPEQDGWVARWLLGAGDGVTVATVQSLLADLATLPRLPPLIPPPGSSVSPGCLVADLVDTDTEPSPVLARIRALLAKAESTEFPAEAELFTAKAQALMSDARVDEAAVRASSGERSASRVSAVRIGVDEPYIASKQSLLQVVCDANDVRCVFSRGVDLATAVGPVAQLTYVELLFTSLLIQVHAALSADAAVAPAGSHTRSRRYRSSFIVGFAARISERLQAARTASLSDAGADTLPVLAADERATAEMFDRLVGRTTPMRSSARYDSRGVTAGSHAADQASLRDAGLAGSAVRRPEGLPGAG